MNENNDFNWQEEPLTQEPAPEMTAQMPQETKEEPAQENIREPEQEKWTADSSPDMEAEQEAAPFSDSSYVIPSTPAREPYLPRYEEDIPETEIRIPKRRKKGGLLKKTLAWTAVLALAAGSCAVTAYGVNKKWEARTKALEASFDSRISELQQQVAALTPEHTGNSQSGTVAVGNGMTAAQVYAKNVRSVVLIEATVTSSIYGQTTSGVSTGSGFILSEDGYVVTNFHVVEGASSVKVVLYDEKSHAAELVGYDKTNDLAVLKVDAQDLDPVELGSSDGLIVGDQVVAIGNPLGELTATLTVGYVSAKERTIDTDGTVINMIQTDAAINSGNSGGPLFNMKGQVVGITTAKYSGSSSSGATIEGIGFAIPMDDVTKSLDELIQFGYIKSAYLGVLVQNLDSAVAEIYGLPVGAYVAGVEDGYCAQKAGIRAKDIIVAVGDVTVKNITDLTRALRDYEPGEQAEIRLYRAGQELTVSVVLDERPASAG